MHIYNDKDYWQLLHRDSFERNNLRPEIAASWQRSYEYGISPEMLSPPMCEEGELLIQPNMDYIVDVAQPLCEQMLNYLPDDHAVIILSNQACVVAVVASDRIKKCFEQFGMRVGACLAEEKAGTSAIALGIKLGEPLQVVGYEHFAQFGIHHGASFAPIRDRSKVVGGVAILGPLEAYDSKILGMAQLVSHSISSRIGIQRWNYLIDRSISDGILAIDEEDRIFYMSKQCHRIMKVPEQNTYKLPLAEIIDPDRPENQYFWTLIKEKSQVTDESVLLSIGERKEPVNCNITITPFDASVSDWSVKIIVIQEMERINRLIRNYSGNSARVTFDDIVGTNPQFLNTLYHAKRSAGTRSNILLLGESGVGKDVLAQAIHNESPRRNGPFIAINCAALPRELIASELFGYEEGAFTGARRGGNLGKFELAHQGTIFLDEIGDMPLDSQAMLLRVIEEKTIVRLGGSKSIPVNVRIIAATNKDLQAEVENNTFRRDLFYRLGVIKIIIPPLRERTEDIAILSQHFLSVLCRRFNLPKKTLSPEVLYAFQNYSWPGNIRELQNILESAVQWSVSPIISKNQVEQLLPAIKPSPQVSIEKIVDPEEPLELKQIKACLAKYDNNKSKTAKALGISRKTLYKRLDKYGISSS